MSISSRLRNDVPEGGVLELLAESGKGTVVLTTIPTALPMGQGAMLRGKMCDPRAALELLAQEPHLLCHAGFFLTRLAQAADATPDLLRAAQAQRHLDVAELFAFAHPAHLAVPTANGLARALGVTADTDAQKLLAVAQALLERLSNPKQSFLRETAQHTNVLARANWPWAPYALQALMKANPKLNVGTVATGLNVWERLDEWQDECPPVKADHQPVTIAEAHAVLRSALGSESEARTAQKDYVATATYGFAPRESPAFNNILLAEAGTGLGKTLGYLSPAYVWAKKNKRPVWLSTYTKNLQRQLDQESARILPDPNERQAQVVIRKGRENYLCLLNMQESFNRLQMQGPRGALLCVLLARWARVTRDGDLVGGDFASWIYGLFPETSGDGSVRHPSPQTLQLTDRRGECIYVACPHYKRCFIEKNQRAARRALLVIANHALVMHQAAVDLALGQAVTAEEEAAPGGLKRIVFDEGHHLFDAADSAFSSHLSAVEAAELRRWLRGPEIERRRGRDLKDRLGDLVSDEDGTTALLEEVIRAAQMLPASGYMRRIHFGMPANVAEQFFTLVRQQVVARDKNADGYALEAACQPLIEGMADTAQQFAEALLRLKRPIEKLAEALAAKLNHDAVELCSYERGRIEAMSRSLRRRGELMLGNWLAMLHRLTADANPLLVEWFSVEQQGEWLIDVGLHSHWLDPTEPLALAVLRPADGVIITSATLKDRPPHLPDDWENAEMRTGAMHLPYPVRREHFASPFDYAKQARIIVVTDVSRDNMDQLAVAYRELFIASGGGALGLFTAISRLRAVHHRIAKPLNENGLSLYAQHVDPMDTATLIDLFRAETDACLLGTDAVRDGVDVPGDSLRLIVMDRVPWSAPSILERARRDTFGGDSYVDMTVRLRLRQAFGRLVRSATDKGCFVVLDSRLPSRFTTAFPKAVAIERLGLVEAIEAVTSFCNTQLSV